MESLVAVITEDEFLIVTWNHINVQFLGDGEDERVEHSAAVEPPESIRTFPSADFAAGVLCRHVPFYAGVQHPQQHVHAGKCLGLADSGLPLFYRCCHLRRRFHCLIQVEQVSC